MLHPIIEEAINNHLRQIEAIKATQEDLELAELLMPDANIWIDNEVNIDWLAKGIDEVKAVLRLFAENGVLLDHFVELSASPVWYLQGKNVKIRLCPNWYSKEADGVTCKLVKVGESTYTSPIYKLICNGKEITNDAAAT